MKDTEIKELIDKGEDSTIQFKSNFTSVDSLAAEITAFLNSRGGKILIGVSDDGELFGLDKDDIQRLNQWVSNVCTNKIEPPVSRILTENIRIDDKIVMVIKVPIGINKFYMANNEDVWVKVGSNKRRAGREEMKRLLQESKNMYADEQSVSDTNISDLDLRLFREFYARRTDEELKEEDTELRTILNKLKIMKNDELTLAGVLLFGKFPSQILHFTVVKAVFFQGNDPADNNYLDSRDIKGNIVELFKEGRSFLLSSIRHKQKGRNFNTVGIPEIPKVAIEEALINALLHRNYFLASNIRLFVFDNRIEIISPGNLPNTATVAGIKLGLHIERNPILMSLIRDMEGIPYRGTGTGIRRIMKECKEEGVEVEFIDEKEINQFKVIFYRD
jgi:predicted HTH transcriptional regulator